MSSRPNSAGDAEFEKLCRLLKIPPRQRTLAHYVKIGRLIDRLRPRDSKMPGDAKQPQRSRWVPDLLKRLDDKGILLSDSMVYRYMKLGTLPDLAFRKACQNSKNARWEDVMRLLPVTDEKIRMELLTLVDDREDEDKLTVRAFKEVILLRTDPDTTQDRRLNPGRRRALVEAARTLRVTSRRGATQAAKWLDGEKPLVAELSGVPRLDPVAAGRLRAAIRQFRAAANRLEKALQPLN